jgi:hypothetical protein
MDAVEEVADGAQDLAVWRLAGLGNGATPVAADRWWTIADGDGARLGDGMQMAGAGNG